MKVEFICNKCRRILPIPEEDESLVKCQTCKHKTQFFRKDHEENAMDQLEQEPETEVKEAVEIKGNPLDSYGIALEKLLRDIVKEEMNSLKVELEKDIKDSLDLVVESQEDFLEENKGLSTRMEEVENFVNENGNNILEKSKKMEKQMKKRLEKAGQSFFSAISGEDEEDEEEPKEESQEKSEE